MSKLLFAAPETRTVAVKGETAVYPVHRIFCVGRNYAAHAAEMGVEVDREKPFYFTKSAQMLQPSGTSIPYPPGTSNFHFEMELVIAIGKPAFKVAVGNALDAVYGYACGLDMTRRDLQLAERAKQRPWDLGKDVEQSAVISSITKAAEFGVEPPMFDRMDIHVHVPEGATPKDGPSAGTAMTTAIVSVMTGIPVRSDVAMTGEITLRGRVLPIGGLKEKLLAALRGGISKVLIPEENAKDLAEIPDNVKNGLEIVPVSHIDQVLEHALVTKPVAIEWTAEDEERARQAMLGRSDNQASSVPH